VQGARPPLAAARAGRLHFGTKEAAFGASRGACPGRGWRGPGGPCPPRRVGEIYPKWSQPPAAQANDALPKDIRHHILNPVVGLALAREPPYAVEVVAQCDNRRLFLPFPLQMLDLAQTHTCQQAIA
jgi:hypothetical protein